MRGGENYTEDVIYFKGRVPNTRSGQFGIRWSRDLTI